MSIVKADRFVQLKSKVKSEVLRRQYNGSVASYGSSTYDYSQTPTTGKSVKVEHIEKLTVPMRAINSDVIPEKTNVIKDTALSNMETRVAVWATRNKIDATGSDCRTSCTGLCYSCVGTCTDACSGCTGTCQGQCGDGCTSCTSCSGCGGSCGYSCGGCDGCSGCGSSCSYGCGGCDGCSGCGSGCATGCSGCGSGCGGGCSNITLCGGCQFSVLN